MFKVWFVEQAREIARRCVQPPLRPRPKDPPFEPRPSLRRVLKFLVEHVKRYPDEVGRPECTISRATITRSKQRGSGPSLGFL